MKRDIVCLYDYTGIAGSYFNRDLFNIFCYDIQHKKSSAEDGITKTYWDAKDDSLNNKIVEKHSGRCALLMSFPPCTDLAVSGARWFADKKIKNPNYREEAIELVLLGDRIGRSISSSHFSENPIGVLSTNWRKYDFSFDPFEYGGYLSEDDAHPEWPEYIAARDAYTKKTCLWTSSNFVMPPKKPIPVLESGDSVSQHAKLGGKSLKTKNIRSATPRGFSKALAELYNRSSTI